MKKETDLMLYDLTRSGLNKSDLIKLKYTPLNVLQTEKLVNRKVESYKIPYFNIDGLKTDFFRVRFTGIEKGFGSKSKMRYTQPAKMSPQFYYPKTINWKKIKNDTSKIVVFTEGEKKAAVLCKHKIPCIGLGGVWNWKSRESIDGLSKDYHDIDWCDREVYIVFDSDIETNINIDKACQALCHQLLLDGAHVYTQHIPHNKDINKTGVDDYILEHGINEFKNITPQPFDESGVLHKINSEYVYCLHPIKYIKRSDQQVKFSLSQFTAHLKNIEFEYMNKSGDVINVPASEPWLKWPHRLEVKGLAYEPGEGEFTHDNKLNTFKPSGLNPIKPKKNQIQPFLDLVDFIFSKEDPSIKKLFLQWVAYPLQYPGSKMYFATIIHSTGSGIGKSLLGLTIGKLYGDNFYEGGSEVIDSDFNSWAVGHQFILVDEISNENIGYKLKRESNYVKRLITRETAQINEKNLSQYTINDYLHYMFTSNHANAVYVTHKERRFLIIDAPVKKLAQEFYNAYDVWYRKKENIESLLHYLLYNIDTSNFKPKDEPPKTRAFFSMAENSMNDLEKWCYDLKLNPDETLQRSGINLPGDLWTCKDLSQICKLQADIKITNSLMNLKLQEIGVERITVVNPPRTYYIVRNQKKWLAKRAVDLHKHYESTRGKKADPRLCKPIDKNKN